MKTHLVQYGNDLALIIEKQILSQLAIQPDTALEVATDGNVLLLTPVNNPESNAKFCDALKEGNTKYAETLKKLAE
jgi:antitoxin component of MazEF toxin-antitoxin module